MPINFADKKKGIIFAPQNRKRSFSLCKGRYQSGQMGLTVTQLATPSVVRIHLCPQRFKRSKCGVLMQVRAEASLLDYAERSRECRIDKVNAEIAQLIEH